MPQKRGHADLKKSQQRLDKLYIHRMGMKWLDLLVLFQNEGTTVQLRAVSKGQLYIAPSSVKLPLARGALTRTLTGSGRNKGRSWGRE